VPHPWSTAHRPHRGKLAGLLNLRRFWLLWCAVECNLTRNRDLLSVTRCNDIGKACASSNDIGPACR
jgi:hypothetical protein